MEILQTKECLNFSLYILISFLSISSLIILSDHHHFDLFPQFAPMNFFFLFHQVWTSNHQYCIMILIFHFTYSSSIKVYTDCSEVIKVKWMDLLNRIKPVAIDLIKSSFSISCWLSLILHLFFLIFNSYC